MKENYDPTSFFEFLKYRPANLPYFCPDQKGLTVFCRGRREQLEEILEPTPFELVDDRFAVVVTDFRNNSSYPYHDAGILLAVRFGDTVGGSFLFEFEDQHFTVASGREKWGYPKVYAHAGLDADDTAARGRVFLGDDVHLDISVDLTAEADPSAWQDLALYPHLQIRAVPEFDGPGFESFQVLSRDTSADYTLTSRHIGPATVELGDAVSFRGKRLDVLEVLGGEYKVGDFAATEENTKPTLLADLARV